MQKIRVLVVDDSNLIRQLLSNLLSTDPEIFVASTAANGKIALEKIPLINPDIVILDIEMPEMNGLDTLRQIKKLYPNLPVIMCSSFTRSSGVATLDALSLGANDYVTKPVNTSLQTSMEILRTALIPRIKALVFKQCLPALAAIENNHTGKVRTCLQVNIVAIGSSTGGPNALHEIIQHLPENFSVPIVIVQHMPPLFTKLLAERLSALRKIPVKEAANGDILEPGKAWLAPGDFHMRIIKNENNYSIQLSQDPPENSCRPAVDVLFKSVAEAYGAHVLGVILTGMGQDGLIGSQAIHKAGGSIIAQDEKSSVVWGMPGTVVHAGVADVIKPLNLIAEEIMERVMISTSSKQRVNQ